MNNVLRHFCDTVCWFLKMSVWIPFLLMQILDCSWNYAISLELGATSHIFKNFTGEWWFLLYSNVKSNSVNFGRKTRILSSFVFCCLWSTLTEKRWPLISIVSRDCFTSILVSLQIQNVKLTLWVEKEDKDRVKTHYLHRRSLNFLLSCRFLSLCLSKHYIAESSNFSP